MGLDPEAVEYALRAVIGQVDEDLDKELSNPKGFSVYPHMASTFIVLYEDYVE